MQKNIKIYTKKLKNALSKEKIKAFFADKRRRNSFIAICSVTLVMLAAVIFGVVYVNDYYRVDGKALSEYTSQSVGNASFTIDDDGLIIATPSEARAGLIFYPGGKVEYSAYLPLMLALAERGILCVLTPMPLNLAVLDMNAADGIAEQFPDIDCWYIGGHSLGGSMAASYLSKNTDEIDGLILLGSYSTADVTGCPVLSVYGSEDGVMNREKYEKYKGNLPCDLTEIIIDGGNHAYFGMYGEQEGDGEARISPKEQIEFTAEKIAEFIVK